MAATSEPVLEQQILGSSLTPAAEENIDQESVQHQNQLQQASSSEIVPNVDKPTEKESEIFKE
jgi:hypothetical protein